MSDASKCICRLCLRTTPACECENLNEIKRETLEFLLIKIDTDISDYAVACNMCLERLQNCFDFKSHITTFVATDIKVDINGFQRHVTSNENSKVCQLCMLLIKDEDFDYITDWKNEVTFKDMLSSCLPEMNLNPVHEQLICKPCLSSTKRLYEFMKNCQEVEHRIENYCQSGHVMGGKVFLEDLLKLEDYDMLSKPIIKKECLDVENVGVNIIKCVKSEENARIQCEEIDIKDELDNRAESVQSQDFDSSVMDGSAKSVRQSEAKAKKQYFCPKCPYSSTISGNIKKHMSFYSDNKLHKCFLCPFTTDAKCSLGAHMTTHKGLTKRLSCPECPFESDSKYNLEHHLLKHKEKSQVQMHKCHLCPYQSKYKSVVQRHQKGRHDMNVKMYKCEKCEYETPRKSYLTAHMPTHENPEVTAIYKCEKCPYRSKTQAYLNRHILIHSDEYRYSCDHCTYSSNIKQYLDKHKRVHQTDGERCLYQCVVCSFQAKTSVRLKYHITRTHTDPSEMPKLKCPHCPFKTIEKGNLTKHLTRKHGSKDQPILKCMLCPYITTDKIYLKKHSIVHKEAMIQCDQCDFRTKRKFSLLAHMHRHNPSKPLPFKCDQCEYRARNKSKLNQHRVTHMKPGETLMYYCATCTYKTKHRRNLKSHIEQCLKRKKNTSDKRKTV